MKLVDISQRLRPLLAATASGAAAATRSSLARLRKIRLRRRRADVVPFEGTPLEHAFALAPRLGDDLWPKLIGTDRRPVRHILVAATERRSGATAVAAATALRLSDHLRSSIGVVELDFEEPRLAAFFGVKTRLGTSELLLGQAELDNCVTSLENHPHLRIVGGGATRRLQPGEFATPALDRLRSDLEQKCRTVVWIAPPLASCADMRLFAARVDGVILVTRAGQTKKSEIARALALLDESGARLVGTVLTGYDSRPPFVRSAA